MIPTGTKGVGIGTTAPSEKLEVVGRIKASDVIESARGLNVTGLVDPSLFGSGFDAVCVNSAAISANHAATFLSNNAYYNGGWKYSSTDAESHLLSMQTDGSFQFYTSSTGTVGNAITFNERMRITVGGNVGIGTDSPSEKLEVVGNIKISGTVIGPDTDWLTADAGGGNISNGKYRKLADGSVEVLATVDGVSISGTLPPGYRPSIDIINNDLKVTSLGVLSNAVGVGNFANVSRFFADGS